MISRDNPAIMFAPDISEMYFNEILGLGDKEHNRRIREIREARRKEKKYKVDDMKLWAIWEIYMD